MANKIFRQKDLTPYCGKKVKMVGTFMYNYKSCRILHCETLQEYVIEQNKLFIDRLKNQSIPNYKFNGVRYLFESRVLYGHIERINNTTIFIYHDDELMV